MSVFAEFRVPAGAFVFTRAFEAEPEMVVEIERVVATDEEYLTPYFWVSGISPEAFEAAVEDDNSVSNLRKLDQSDIMTIYRADWREHVEALVYAYTHIGASILEAKGIAKEWILRMRFDDRENIDGFTEYLRGNDLSFELRRIHEISHPRPGEQFGLTPKQTEALVTAWEMGYFDLPRVHSQDDIADALGITGSSLSDRFRRGLHTLVGNTLLVTGETEVVKAEPESA